MYWQYKREICYGLSFAHETALTPKIFSVVAPCSLADMHQHFGAPAASIIRVMEVAGSSQSTLHIYRLTVAGPRWQETSLSPPWEPQIPFYMTVNTSVKSVWCRDIAFDLLVSAARGQTMPHFIFFPPILDSTEAELLSFVTSWNTVPDERKSLCHFHMFVFLGVHFTAFGVLEHFMNAEVFVLHRHQVWVVFYLLFV